MGEQRTTTPADAPLDPATAGAVATVFRKRAPPREPFNPLDAFVAGLERLTQSTQATIAQEIKSNPSSLSFFRTNERDCTRETARSCIAKLAWRYRRARGFSDLWKLTRPNLNVWFHTLKTRRDVDIERRKNHRMRGAANGTEKNDAFNSFLEAILEQEKGLTIAKLKKIEGGSGFNAAHNRLGRESTQRIIYLLAGLYPLPYVQHKDALAQWTGSLKSNKKAVPKNEIGLVTREIISRSFVENGLTERQFALSCNVSPTTFITNFLTGNLSQQLTVQYGFGLSQHASRSAWLESAALYYAGANARPSHRNGRPTKAESEDVDVSISALGRRIHDDWRGAGLEVIRRATELKPDLAVLSPITSREDISAASTLKKGWQQMLESNPQQPPPLDLNFYRAALEAVRREFEAEAEQPLLPVHLHNKPGHELRAAEIAPQIDWLLGLQIPQLAV